MQIQWYPGHMTKAKRMLAENLKYIDVVIEIVDARAPASTRNPDFNDMFKNKYRVVLLNKSDLASKSATSAWINYFKSTGIAAAEFVATNSSKRKAAIAAIERAAAEKIERMRNKGVNATVRAIIVGIPNVGKSTFINTIAGSVRAKTGDRPGVTQGKQWVKITDTLELMDTPGLLWPRFDDELVARRIAYIGSVRDDVLDFVELASQLLVELVRLAPDAVAARYKYVYQDVTVADALDAVCKSRGFMLPGGVYDTERAARIVLDEYRAGKIAKVTFEMPPSPQKETKEDSDDKG